MIEFALLFGLGFLSALLIAMLVAPAIHRRIVYFTENRIRATVPISPQEVRAQRDMARALYAAENARTKQELRQERDRTVSLKLKNEGFQENIKALIAENLEIKARLDATDVTAVELRSQLRQDDGYIADMKSALDSSEDAGVGKDLEIERLRREMEVLGAKNDNATIDLSTRETEIENLKFRISALREEREGLRQDVRLQTTRAKDAETRLAQEEHRAMRLEDKLSREVSLRTDKEVALERRSQEIDRLREKMKVRPKAVSKIAPPVPALIEVGPRQQEVSSESLVSAGPDVEVDTVSGTAANITAGRIDPEREADRLSADAKSRATALSERLMNGKGTGNDEALRQEMATIAADMVAMTAIAEGANSPIHAMIAGKSAAGGEKSLAARVRSLLTSTGETSPR